MWPALITDAMHTCWALFPQKPLVSEWRPTGVLYNWALIRQLVEGRSGLRSRSPALLSEEHSPTLVLHNVFVEHCSTSTRQEPHQGTLGPRNGVETSSLRLGLLQQLNFTQSSVKYNDTLSSSLPLFFPFSLPHPVTVCCHDQWSLISSDSPLPSCLPPSRERKIVLQRKLNLLTGAGIQRGAWIKLKINKISWSWNINSVRLAVQRGRGRVFTQKPGMKVTHHTHQASGRISVNRHRSCPLLAGCHGYLACCKSPWRRAGGPSIGREPLWPRRIAEKREGRTHTEVIIRFE